jgi:hypothetical protein
VFGNCAADPFDDSDDQRVSHAKGALYVGHAGVRPTAREPVQLFEFFRNQAAVSAVWRLNDVLEARGRRTAFSGQDGSGRSVERVRKRQRAFRVVIAMIVVEA